MQKTKARVRVDTQSFDLKDSEGSKRRLEAVEHVADLSKKRQKVVVHTTSTPRCPTKPKERMGGFSTSDKDLRVALLKSRFADTIFKAQQQIKSVKTDLKNSVGSKRRPEAVDCIGDLPKKKLKVAAVDTTSAPQCPTMPKEPMRALEGVSTSDKYRRAAMLKHQRDKERRAARIALEEMTNTAGIEHNTEVQWEFDNLIGCSSSLWW